MRSRFLECNQRGAALGKSGKTAKAVGHRRCWSITSLKRGINERERGAASEDWAGAKFVQPSLRDCGFCRDRVPNVETLGYFRTVPPGPTMWRWVTKLIAPTLRMIVSYPSRR